jgi:NADH:ubiquinone oxidoreductase subunit E
VELTTFSMVLRFTLQLEDRTAQFYRNLAAESKLTQAKELFARFVENSDKRKKELERTARESVDHSLLEPVSGIFEETYGYIPDSSGTAVADAVTSAKKLEEEMQKFYIEAGDKIKFVSNVSRLYRRYAQDRAKALVALQALA